MIEKLLQNIHFWFHKRY